MAEKRIGRQTPTKSFVLPYKASRYQEAVDIYERSGQKVLEWQKLLLKDIMAVNDDGLWTHMSVGFSVPRRNGKTEVLTERELWGLEHGEKIVHTAHRTNTSHDAWDKLKRLLEKSGYEEKEDFQSNKAKGAESLELYDTGGRIFFRTRSGTGGLGEGFDLLVIDEAQEYTSDQQSALDYTITSSPNPQIIMCGTPPTAVSKGTVFEPYRRNCLAGTAEDSMWSEWSIDEEAKDRSNPDLWFETNPSLGLLMTERAVKRELAGESTDFNIQRLGLWLSYNQSSAITEQEWQKLKVSSRPEFTGRLFVGIKYGKDNKNVSLSVAVKTTDGRTFVECLDCRPIAVGNGWILETLQTLDAEKIVVDGANGQGLLCQQAKEAGLRKKPILPKVPEIIEANASFTLAVQSETLCHNGQPSLAAAVCNCEKRAIGSNGGFGYRSQNPDIDVSLMDSSILAYWACITHKEPVKQRASY